MHCCCCEHRHKFKCRTGCCEDHTHKIKGYTCCSDNVCNHRHILEGCCSSKDDHSHRYCIETSPAILLPCGGHYHYVDSETNCYYGHVHDVCFEIEDKKTDLC